MFSISRLPFAKNLYNTMQHPIPPEMYLTLHFYDTFRKNYPRTISQFLLRVEYGLPTHATKLDENALLKWLELHPDIGLLHAGVSFEEYVKSLSMKDLQKEFPEFVSDKFLQKKDFCVYINTFFDWEEVKGKKLGEIEKIVRAAAGDNTKKMGIYVGKYGGGQKSRPGHMYEGACFDFLEENEGSVGFTTFVINCNSPSGCIATSTGADLRKLVTESEAIASKLEAFIIEFGFSREKLPFNGMRQFLINKKREPVDDKSKEKAQRLAKQASIFDFSVNKGYCADGDQEFLWKGNAPLFFKERIVTSAEKKIDVVVIS
ncbi:uncharacterized protein LOC118434202 [Folsomia candida]|nr:uncharacterized protein LOC118434202 [Folsomia candida]